ncbi:MAG: hypothetical protein B6D55_07550, partial [Candidatus Omnitrophica bacterium 4484_70.2]
EDKEIYNEEDIIEAFQRLQKNVLQSQKIEASFAKDDFAYIAKNETNICGMFNDSLFVIYILVMRYMKNQENKEEKLEKLDEYMKDAFKYAANLYCQGAGDARYEDKLKEGDPYIWGKLELYFKYWRDQLREKLRDGKDNEFENILKKIGISEGKFKVGSEKEYWKNKEIENPTWLDKIKLWFFPDSQPPDGSFYSFLKTFGFEYPHLVNLEETKPSKIGRIKRQFQRFTGIGMRSVHPYGVVCSYFLRYLPVLLGISTMYGGREIIELFSLKSFSVPFPLVGLFSVPSLVLPILFAFSMVLSIYWEYKQISKYSYLKPAILRVALAISWGIFAYFCGFLPVFDNNIGVFFIKLILITLSVGEMMSILLWRHSLLGISFYLYFHPVGSSSRKRAIIMYVVHEIFFLIIVGVLSYFVFPWFFEHFVMSTPSLSPLSLRIRTVIAFYFLINTLYITNYACWIFVVFISSLISPTKGPKLDNDIEKAISDIKKGINVESAIEKIKRKIENQRMNINYVGMPLFPFFNSKKAMSALRFLYKEKDQWIMLMFKVIKEKFDLSSDEEVFKEIEKWLNLLYQIEKETSIPCWTTRQLTDPTLGDLYLNPSEENREKLIFAFLIRWFTDSWVRTDFSYNTGVYIANLVEEIHSLGLDDYFIITVTDNKYSNHNTPPYPEQIYKAYLHCRNHPFSEWEEIIRRLFPMLSKDDREKIQMAIEDLNKYETFAKLIYRLSEGKIKFYYTYQHDLFSSKATSMLGVNLITQRLEAIEHTHLHVLDRQAEFLDVEARVKDFLRIMSNPKIANLDAYRTTSNTLMPIGLRFGFYIEHAHGEVKHGLPQEVCTGWGSCCVNRWKEALIAYGKGKSTVPFENLEGNITGIWPFGLTPIEPSEDTANLYRQVHNMIALGKVPIEYAVSEALGRKQRESFWKSAGLSAHPRWAGGLLKMHYDPVYQMTHIFGPQALIERIVLLNDNNFYYVTPFAFLNTVLLIVFTLLDILPFTGVIIVLWIFGTLFNQVLCLNGLLANLRARGKLYGFARFVIDWLFNLFTFAPNFIVNLKGVLHSLFGMINVFRASGGGDNYDKSNWWKILLVKEDREVFFPRILLGITSLGIILMAIAIYIFSEGLDLSNIILLILPLWFISAIAIGIFVVANRPGRNLGKWVWGVRIVGVGLSSMFIYFLFEGAFWYYVGAFSIFVVILVSSFICHLLCRKLKEEDIWKKVSPRIFSELIRTFFIWTVLFIWPIFVPLPDSVNFTITSTWIVEWNFKEFIMGLGIILGILAIPVTIGLGWGYRYKKKLEERYCNFMNGIQLSSLSLSQLALLTEFHIAFSCKEYRHAEDALKGIEENINAKIGEFINSLSNKRTSIIKDENSPRKDNQSKLRETFSKDGGIGEVSDDSFQNFYRNLTYKRGIFICDLGGTLVNPGEKVRKGIIKNINRILERGDILIILTGQSIDDLLLKAFINEIKSELLSQVIIYTNEGAKRYRLEKNRKVYADEKYNQKYILSIQEQEEIKKLIKC